MNELKVIENELVPVYETDKGEKVVYGSELHTALEVKSRYREWIDRRINDCEAVENEDYQAAEISAPSGQTRIDHIIKLDTAKEMAMLERNEKGKQVRRYFIDVEKKHKESSSGVKSPLDLLRLEFKAIEEVDSKVDAVNRDLQEFKMNLPILGIESERITSAVHKRGVNALGGKKSNAYHDRSLRGKIYADIYRELKRQFGVASYREIRQNQCDLAISVIDGYELPYILTEQVAESNAQLNIKGIYI